MKDEYKKLFSSEEIKLIKKLEDLFEDWNLSLKKYYENNGEEKWIDSYYYESGVSFDGIFPQYLSKKNTPKILYIGRESYSCSEFSYIEFLLKCYLNGIISGKSINAYRFHRLLLKTSYGIIQDKEWEDVSSASEICNGKKFFSNTSFAFMNISKFSNENACLGKTGTDWQLVNKSLEMSITKDRNFILDEIQLLNPDYIITMGFGEKLLQRVFGDSLKKHQELDRSGLIYSVCINGKTLLLSNPYHFSSAITEKEYIYDPLRTAWKKTSSWRK